MIGRRVGRSPRSEPSRDAGPRALTSDFWYTLAYVTAPERRRLEAGRVRIWADAMVRAGIDRPRALKEVGRLIAAGRAAEARGSTPPIDAQADALSRRLGLRRPLRGGEIGEALDRNLLRRTVRVAPGAKRALGRLRRDGILLGIVSNVLFETADGARALLDRLDLRSPFDGLYLSAEHPWAKPRPQPFRMILRELGAAPDRSAHIGDLRWDVDGARRAGLTPWLYTGLYRFESPRPAIPRRAGAPLVRIRRWDEVPAKFGA